MRELVPTLEEWSARDPSMAVATVVRTHGSTPRPAGARLIVSADGRIAGSVSGGCLEADVVEQARLILSGRQPPALHHYGITDEMGWSVGLSCGGTVDIFVESWRWEDSDPALAASILREIKALGFIGYAASRELKMLSPPAFGCGQPDCSR